VFFLNLLQNKNPIDSPLPPTSLYVNDCESVGLISTALGCWPCSGAWLHRFRGRRG